MGCGNRHNVIEVMFLSQYKKMELLDVKKEASKYVARKQ